MSRIGRIFLACVAVSAAVAGLSWYPWFLGKWVMYTFRYIPKGIDGDGSPIEYWFGGFSIIFLMALWLIPVYSFVSRRVLRAWRGRSE